MKNSLTVEINQRTEKYKLFTELATQLPGIGIDSTTTFIAESGVDMSVFPNANHFVSWLGLSPTNNESADK